MLLSSVAQIPLSGVLALGIGSWDGLGMAGPAVSSVATMAIAALLQARALWRGKMGFTPACPELPTHPPLDTDPQHVLVRECARISANVAGTDGKPQGVPFWSDAALFNQFGKIPAIVFGPGDVGVAHSNHEFVPVDELTKGAQVFALLAASLVGAKN